MPKNSFQELIAARAISVAKNLCHEQAGKAHVLVAIAETVLQPADRYSRSQILRQHLPSKGESIKLPTISQEAEEFISSCPDARTALAALNDAPDNPIGAHAVATESESAVEEPIKRPEVNEKNARDLLSELDALVGLKEVKQQLRRVISVVEANRVRAEAGAKPVPQSLHLVFTGNPGTGKTTVARIVARLYGATGALKGNKFREASRADLIAPFVGQTAQQTERVMKSVRPGVLFIDEAYALKPTHSGDFAEECVATMVKGMEDHRAELAVIVAGYKEEMGNFIKSNPGLRSRFQTFIQFDDYSIEDLLEIYRRFAADSGIRLAVGVEEQVHTAITNAVEQEGFGNARFIRALWEESYANMAVRAAEDGETVSTELEEIAVIDIPAGVGSGLGVKRKIGF